MDEETKKLLREIGFGDYIDRVERGECARCRRPMTPEVSDPTESEATGMCAQCLATFW